MNQSYNNAAPNHSNSTSNNAEATLELQRLERSLIKKFRVLSSVAQDLAQIRDKKLYPTPTFEEYSNQRWGFDAQTIDYLCNSVKVVENLQNIPFIQTLANSNLNVLDELFNLTQQERIVLGKRIEEFGLTEVTAEFVHSIKSQMFPEKCKGHWPSILA